MPIAGFPDLRDVKTDRHYALVKGTDCNNNLK